MTRTLAALVLTAGLAAPAAAQQFQDMSEADREAFGDAVRSYLLENPEVLMEAIGVLEQREAEAQAEADRNLALSNMEALHDDGHSWVGGNPEGDVTLVEFIDYRCGYCRRAYPEVEELIAADGNIRLILKEFPILGEDSTKSSQFAIAVKQIHGDAIYKDIHDALITLRGEANEENLQRLAEGFGLDPQPIFERMESEEVAEVISENRALAEELQITGTPTFVLEDQMLRGYVPLAQMERLVEAARDERG
ncbi:DsbA family protein [Histidinibacterium aquaticum]|uniref:DsbA family protein n=1 Tax=Histidinibacterium aquaticum TaxID=2613962 RepID=A0A5J5GN43_9RHOB|nr:DsbA family protein [Histidinibacterium aquaticum]KAA9008964.1 DsbA family protein [Histidinibacterium aquaticum]